MRARCRTRARTSSMCCRGLVFGVLFPRRLRREGALGLATRRCCCRITLRCGGRAVARVGVTMYAHVILGFRIVWLGLMFVW